MRMLDQMWINIFKFVGGIALAAILFRGDISNSAQLISAQRLPENASIRVESRVSSSLAVTPFSFIIFRDTDSLTLYIASQGEVALTGLVFAVNDSIYPLENFASFRGIPFDRVPTPICFRLVRTGASSPLPLECPASSTLIQPLQNANVFWYDSVLVQELTLLIQNEDVVQGICAAGQVQCELTYTPSLSTETEIAPPGTPQPASEDCLNDFDVPMAYISDGRSGVAFCIDKYEVTNSLYRQCENAALCDSPTNDDSRLYKDYYDLPLYAKFPVVNVNWEQAQRYCEYRGGRLPTEDEWLLAASYDPAADDTRLYPWGDQSPDTTRANYDNRIGDTVEVGSYPNGVSAWDVYDLSGNVAEWLFDPDPSSENGTGNSKQVIRGGSYEDDASQIRVDIRNGELSNISGKEIGFRCVVIPL